MNAAALNAYRQLERCFRRISLVGQANGFLGWDWATMMPPGAAESRADQIAELGLIRHELIVDPGLADLLDRAETGADRLTDWQRANLLEMRRGWRHAAAVPGDLVEALTKAGSACEMAWREARPNDDFAGLLPKLREVVNLVRQVAAAKATALDCTPYDALLDTYEPGGRAAFIDPIFDDLAAFLPDFTERVIDRQATAPAPPPLTGRFPVDAQKRLGERLMATIGFPFESGRLDVSLHPFSGGTPDDLRITTRYDECDWTRGLMAVLHETGHALYERGLPRDWRNQPVGKARGMSLHESQSLLIEMQVCRSRSFLDYAAPIIRETLGADGPAWSVDALYRRYTKVERGLIRVDADEVTYPAHVILRYRLERAMIAGDLEIGNLPGAWRAAMGELVGTVPTDDRDGCLQDIHWMDGHFGYFPTYTLGAMTATQLFAAAHDADPDIVPAIGRGDFKPLYAWLGTNVHGLASSLSGDEILTRATGRSLDVETYKTHLRDRYLPAE